MIQIKKQSDQLPEDSIVAEIVVDESLSNIDPTNFLESAHCLFASHHYSISTDEIYHMAQKPEGGESFEIQDVISVAAQLGFKTDLQSCTWERLKEISLPALLFLNNGSAITLLAFEENESILSELDNDEKITHKRVALSELQTQFANQVLTLEPNVEVLTLPDTTGLSALIDKKLLRTLFEVLVATSVISLFQLALPLFSMNVYDKVVPNAATETLWVLASGICIIFVLDYIFRISRQHLLENLSARIGESIDVQLLRKILGQNRAFSSGVGVNTEMFHEMQNFRAAFFGKMIVELIEAPFVLLFLFVIYLISPILVLVPIAVGFGIFVLNVIHHYPIVSLGKKNYTLRKERESFLIETLQGKENIKIANAFAKFLYRWSTQVKKGILITRKSQMWNGSLGHATPLLVQSVSVLVIIVGAFQIFEKQLSLGGLIACSILSARAILPMVNFGNAVVRFYTAMPMLKQWRQTLRQSSDYDTVGSMVSKGKYTGNILIKDVDFNYSGNSQNSLKKINLHIRPGEHVIIAGRSGAGKSTLLRLLANLEKTEQGNIYLDNYNIADLHPFELHRQVSLMTQSPAFFSGTVHSNIDLGTRAQKESYLSEMLTHFGLDQLLLDEISGGGLAFEIGEQGSRLSGGQRQMVALLRALAYDHAVYLLDEPTAGMDSILEARVIDYLRKRMKNQTMIIVSHRPDLFALADRMIILEKGQIVADGPRDEILKKAFKKSNKQHQTSTDNL